MDIGPILHLIEALKEHPKLGQDIVPKYFHGLLKSIEVQPSRRFYYEVEANVYHLPSKSGQSCTFSIDLILRNQVAGEYRERAYKPSPVTKLRSKVSSKKKYNAIALSRNLRNDPKIVEMMANALFETSELATGAHYSILGRVETFDDASRKFERMPVIAIPRRDIKISRSGEDITSLLEWESANIQYGLRYPSGIETPLTREQYLKTPSRT